MNLKTEISKIHYGKKSKWLGLLRFFSLFYGFGSEIKNVFYDLKILAPKKVDAYVISVGNLTTGGVGKTPFVAELVKKYISKGKKVGIVSRGYGGRLKGVNVISDGKEVFFTSDVAGDEPYWLAKNTQAVVITSPVRYEGANLAVKKYGVDIVVLDDGFQHRKLHRDLDVVLVDSEKRFGNEYLLPAGPMRESIKNIKRADKIVVVSKNVSHYGAYEYANVLMEQYKKPMALCRIEPDCIYNVFNTEINLDKKERVVAFSGIGQPQQFYKFLNGYSVFETIDFDDHHKYSQKDAEKLDKYKLSLVTTEKDAVKCRDLKFKEDLYALKLRTVIEDLK